MKYKSIASIAQTADYIAGTLQDNIVSFEDRALVLETVAAKFGPITQQVDYTVESMLDGVFFLNISDDQLDTFLEAILFYKELVNKIPPTEVGPEN